MTRALFRLVTSALLLCAAPARADNEKVPIRDGDAPATSLKRFQQIFEARYGHLHKGQRGAEILIQSEHTIRTALREAGIATNKLVVTIEPFLDKKSVGLCTNDRVRQAIFVWEPTSKVKLRMPIRLIIESLGEEMWHHAQHKTVPKFYWKYLGHSLTRSYEANAYENEAKIIAAKVQHALWTNDLLTISKDARKLRVFKAMREGLKKVRADGIWKKYPLRLQLMEARLDQLIKQYEKKLARPPAGPVVTTRPPTRPPPAPPPARLPAKLSWRDLEPVFPTSLAGLTRTQVVGNNMGQATAASVFFRGPGKQKITLAIRDDARSAAHVARTVQMMLRLKGRLPPGKLRVLHLGGHPSMETDKPRKQQHTIQQGVWGRFFVIATSRQLSLARLRKVVSGLNWAALGKQPDQPQGTADLARLRHHPWGRFKVGARVQYRFTSKSMTSITGQRTETLKELRPGKLIRTVQLSIRGQTPEWEEWEELPRLVKKQTITAWGKVHSCAVYSWQGGRKERTARRTIWRCAGRILSSKIVSAKGSESCTAVAAAATIKVGQRSYACTKLTCKGSSGSVRTTWLHPDVPGGLVRTVTTAGGRTLSSMELLGITATLRSR